MIWFKYYMIVRGFAYNVTSGLLMLLTVARLVYC